MEDKFKYLCSVLFSDFKLAELDISDMNMIMGMRFKPTDDEIIHLLKKKRRDPNFSVPTIREIDINKSEPWDLLSFSGIQPKEEPGYLFYKPRKYAQTPRKYAKTDRCHRRTKEGYWKVTATVTDMKAKNSAKVVGKKKILVFRSHNTGKTYTEWVMHEISVEDSASYKEDFVVGCLKRKQDTEPVTKRRIKSRRKRGICEDQSSQNLASRNRVAENTCAESHLLPSDHAVDAEFNPDGGCSRYGCETSNSQSYSENISPAFQNESLRRGKTGQTFTATPTHLSLMNPFEKSDGVNYGMSLLEWVGLQWTDVEYE